MDTALVEQFFRVFQNKGELRKCRSQILDRIHFFFLAGLLFLWKFAQQYVVVDGPEQSVSVKILFVPEGDGLLYHQFMGERCQFGKGKPTQVLDGDAYKLMLLKIIQFVEQHLFKRIYHKRILKSWCPIGNL